MLQEAVILYLQLTRGLASPMTALRNPNPKFEAPSNLALQYTPALRPEFLRYIFSLKYHSLSTNRIACLFIQVRREIYIILVD